MELQLRSEEILQFEALKKQSQTIAENCSKLTVTDATSLAIATQNLSKAKESIRNIEKIRKATKDPYLKAGQQLDALARNLSSPIEDALKAGEKAILEYNKIEEQKARQEQSEETINLFGAEFTTTSTIKDKWMFEVVKLTDMPPEWLMPDDRAIKAWIKEAEKLDLEDDKIISGVRFYKEKQLKIR